MSLALTFERSGAAAIFGGSGGVGAAIAKRFAEAGVDVAFTYHRSSARADAVIETARRLGTNARAYQLDLRDIDASRRVVAQMAADFGTLHTAIYSAGPIVDLKPLAQIDPETFRDFIAQDLLGFFNMAHAMLPHLRTSKGSLVACVSMAIKAFLARDVLSAAPKAGVELLVRQLAGEEGRNGVRANAVALGWIMAGVGNPEGDTSLVQEFGAAELEFWLKRSALGRGGSGEELANIVLFLASQQASYLTGQTLFADGGQTL